MKKSPSVPALAPAREYRRVFRQGEAVLLTLSARWPLLENTSPGARRVNRYYTALAQRCRTHWEGALLEQAKAACGPEMPPWSATLEHTITCFQGGLLSLTLDIREETGGKPRILRLGDIWALPAGVPVRLWELLPKGRWRRGAVVNCVREQIAQRIQSGESIFYEDWPKLASKFFSPERCFLGAEGLSVFYPMESIAPALEGFPTFSLASLCPENQIFQTSALF